MQTTSSAQNAAYMLYYGKVFGYVMNRVHVRADAEDITAEVFLKLFSKSDGFDWKRPGASTYVFRVMQTTLVDFYRQKKITTEPLEEMEDKIGVDDDFDAALLSLNGALNVLNERELAIVVLHYYHGLSHKEISEKMRLSYSNVRQICHVSIQKLRKEMEK